MHTNLRKLTILLVTFLTLGPILSSIACEGDNDGGNNPSVAQPSSVATSEPPVTKEPVKITIGNLTDLTGPASNQFILINTAFEDIVRYYNENSLIPGVELEVVSYDGQLDPANDIPGYEWLKERGADLIFTCTPDTPLTLKPIVDKEKMPLFASNGCQEMLDTPGYVFIIGVIPEHQAYTLLNWIAENDWDYESNGPAKIGGASWIESYSQSFMDAMQEYAEAHPDQFEWIGGHLSNFTFNWGAEAEALKDCDYVYPCISPVAFVKEYRSINDTTKFIGGDPHLTWFSQVDAAQVWDEIDGTLYIRGGSLWWNEDEELINLAKEILYKYHPNNAEQIIREGAAYASVAGVCYPILEMIADAVETVGAENFTSQALYDAAISYSQVFDEVEWAGFTQTRRYAYSNYLIYRASAADEDIIRADENWIPHLVEP